MPAFVAVAVVLPVMILIAWRSSVVLHFFIVAPLVPSMATIPVTVPIAKGDVAKAHADTNSNAADMDTDSYVLSVRRSRRRESGGGEAQGDDHAI
jgi:hypothetical protein